MTTEEIKQNLISLIYELFNDKGGDINLIETVDLLEEFGMDSILFIELVVEIENHFDIIINEDLLRYDNFHNINDIVTIVELCLKDH